MRAHKKVWEEERWLRHLSSVEGPIIKAAAATEVMQDEASADRQYFYFKTDRFVIFQFHYHAAAQCKAQAVTSLLHVSHAMTAQQAAQYRQGLAAQSQTGWCKISVSTVRRSGNSEGDVRQKDSGNWIFIVRCSVFLVASQPTLSVQMFDIHSACLSSS